MLWHPSSSECGGERCHSAYNEVAYHSGIEPPDVFDILHKLDKQIPRLETAARQAPRPYHLPYHLVVLSTTARPAGRPSSSAMA